MRASNSRSSLAPVCSTATSATAKDCEPTGTRSTSASSTRSTPAPPAPAVAGDLGRLEPLRGLVAMQAREPAFFVEIAADVTRQVAGRQPRLSQRPGADRQPVEQLDVHEPVPPGLLDQTTRDE